MATPKQKTDLIEALKFTPREIEITLSGYGGEIVLGRISEEAYDFWKDRDDLDEFMSDWDNEMEIPPEARFVTDGSWYDCDDFCHENGCEASDMSYITVEDLLEHKTLFESTTDLAALAARGVETDSHSHFRVEEDVEPGTAMFMGQSIEKGVFFSGTIRITQPFNPELLSISWTDCDGWKIIDGVMYDGEDVNGQDAYSTSGKSMEFRVYKVEKQDNWDAAAELDKILKDMPLIEGEEMWASEAIDSDPETWNDIPLTQWWPGNSEPVHRGEYEVLTAGDTWPFPQRARWTGRKWLDGKTEIEVSKWRGLCQPA